MRFLPVNLDALLVELDDLPQTLALFASLQAEAVAGIDEVVPAARTLLVRFRPASTTAAVLADAIGRRRLDAVPARAERRIEIPVRYDGEDLADVATRLGLTPDEVVRRHTGRDYSVAFTGFAPGFAYLTDGDPSLDVPRRSVPRTRIPAGAVALAGRFSGVYPRPSPGGWQIIGVTDTKMWDLARTVPGLLQPGDAVRFVDAGRMASADVEDTAGVDASPVDVDAPGVTASPADVDAPRVAASPAGAGAPGPAAATTPAAAPAVAAAAGAAAAPGSAAGPPDRLAATAPPDGVRFTVRAAGLQALFQDAGRGGRAGQGVSASGAMDRRSLQAANRLVGNPTDAVCIEAVYGGFTLVAEGDTVVAVTGAEGPLRRVSAAGPACEAARWQPIALAAGDAITIGEPRAGIRSYLAVRGGFATVPVLGSGSTDTLSDVGPPPLASGDVLVARPGRSVVGNAEVPPADLPTLDEIVVLDVVIGPRDDWFTADALARFRAQLWTVTPQSNRVGLRLAGEVPLARNHPAELPSEGTLRGSIQVPPSGQPVLFMADHPLTGGYPVIASVATHHLDRAGQVPVGARIRFNPLPGSRSP